jgi:DNA-binding GntR family transcriptional regulator
MADQIAAAIRDSIANGKLPPGMHLLEAEIAREMQTSRIPVREALMQLEREGLVVREPNRGTFVAELTEKMVREVSSLRGLLEGYAASQTAKRLTEADFTYLDGLIKEMFVAARAGNFSHVLECDYQFHKYIVHAAGHDLLEEVWRNTDKKIRVYLSATNLMRTDLRSIAESHKVTLAALRAHDPEGAKKAMMKHIHESLDPLVTRILSTVKP